MVKRETPIEPAGGLRWEYLARRTLGAAGRRFFWSFSVCAGLVFLSTALLFSPVFPVLSIRIPNGGLVLAAPGLSVREACILAVKRKSVGVEFSVSYTHSVNKSRVWDTWQIVDDGQLRLISSRFSAYGAGIPEPEEGQHFLVLEDSYVIEGFDLVQPSFRLFVGRIADHALEVSGQRILLKDIVPPGTSLEIIRTNQSLYSLLSTPRGGRESGSIYPKE